MTKRGPPRSSRLCVRGSSRTPGSVVSLARRLSRYRRRRSPMATLVPARTADVARRRGAWAGCAEMDEPGNAVNGYLAGLARLAVRVGAGVTPGQDVIVFGWGVEQAPIVRAVAEEAYVAGARFVSVQYWDQVAKRARLLHAPADSLDFVPDWFEALATEAVERRSALIHVWGDPHRDLFEGVDPA